MTNAKNTEYHGGYAPIHEAMLLEVIAQNRTQRAGFKTLVRVFAAMAEKQKQKAGSKVDLYRIVNCKSSEKGIRRLSGTEIAASEIRVGEIAEQAKSRPERRKRPVSRKVLRAIAQGRLSASESILLLFYASRRITQSKEMQRLLSEERYARFTYSEVKELSGLEKSRTSEALAKLKEKGLLSSVEVHQSNVNVYGLCFVDGWLISLVRRIWQSTAETVDKAISTIKKTAMPLLRNSNGDSYKTAMLRKKNIKRITEKDKDELKKHSESMEELFERLKKRCLVSESEIIPQTALI